MNENNIQDQNIEIQNPQAEENEEMFPDFHPRCLSVVPNDLESILNGSFEFV